MAEITNNSPITMILFDALALEFGDLFGSFLPLLLLLSQACAAVVANDHGLVL
jgi:hypothetical protein